MAAIPYIPLRAISVGVWGAARRETLKKEVECETHSVFLLNRTPSPSTRRDSLPQIDAAMERVFDETDSRCCFDSYIASGLPWFSNGSDHGKILCCGQRCDLEDLGEG